MDDLVAELTLKFRDEMSGGLDEIKGQFGALDGTLQGLRDVLTELNTTIADLKLPPTLDAGFADVSAAAGDAATAVAGIGTAIDDDVAKLQQLKTEMGTLPEGVQPNAMPGVMPGEPPLPNEPGPREPREPGPYEPGAGAPLGDVGTHLMMGAVEASVAKESAEKYAEFNQILYQTAIKEGYNHDAAQGEVTRLNTYLDSLALSTGNSSTSLAEAYYWLTTTGMPKKLIEQMMPNLAQDATAYNNDPMEDAQSVYTLNSVLNVPADQMGVGLSVISRAAQLGHFGVGDFGQFLPGLATQLNFMKDTGIGGEVQLAAALESSRKAFGTSGQEAADVTDLLSYLSSPTAARFFDRTQRSEDLLSEGDKRLFAKYHIDKLDIPAYLDKKEAAGEGSFDAMMDLAAYVQHKLPANVSGTDQLEIFKALFHNQQAAEAAMGIAQNFDVFKADETALYGVNSGQVQGDFATAISSPQAQVNIVNEQYDEMVRTLGQNVLPSLTLLGGAANVAMKALNEIGHVYDTDFASPVGDAIGTAAAYGNHYIHPGRYNPALFNHPHAPAPAQAPQRLDIHLHGLPPGTSATAAGAPGTSVTVNQGQVLGAP